MKILRTEGLVGIKARLRKVIAQPAVPLITPELCADCEARLGIVPHYIDPDAERSPVAPDPTPSVAVHVHLYYTDMLGEFTSRLAAMPCAFDLFVSVPQHADCAGLGTALREALPRAGQVVVEPVPNRGRDIAPLIVQFGGGWPDTTSWPTSTPKKPPLRRPVGLVRQPPGRAAGPPGQQRRAHGQHHRPAPGPGQGRLSRGTDPDPEGPHGLGRQQASGQGSAGKTHGPFHRRLPGRLLFRGQHVLGACALPAGHAPPPLSWNDFPAEPIPADGTLAHALERLLLIFASASEGQCLRLHQGDSIPDYRHYEEQCDYSAGITHGDVRILSYYLPQFHPIPENDAWHGEGFTEWTKVRAANPLFIGHYQQHIPHPDIGYYLLETADTLRMQASLMRKAGIHGQIFYHYWFSGQLILENPAQMLLEAQDIDMPFCFCWANENWTRRWDGNEQDILLQQDYSAEDARAFIRYLLPFFRDPRHIRIDDRPVLFVYRPVSMPDPGLYISIWAEECRSAGLNPPYVVAVLTRGATDPGISAWTPGRSGPCTTGPETRWAT